MNIKSGLLAYSLAGLVSFTSKAQNAVELIKENFPALKNATQSIEPSQRGQFGVLLKNKTDADSIKAYAVGVDKNNNKQLEIDEVENIYISAKNSMTGKSHNFLMLNKINDSTFNLMISSHTSGRFPIKKDSDPKTVIVDGEKRLMFQPKDRVFPWQKTSDLIDALNKMGQSGFKTLEEDNSKSPNLQKYRNI